jgi:RimJ/RimL family protein N-acetyltransferase
MPETEGAVREADARDRKTSPILTRRLKLRRLRDRDLVELARLSASEAVRQNLTIALAPENDADAGHPAFAIERRQDRAVIGAGGYCPLSGSGGCVEFALWIGEAHWGQGYGTEAAQALVDRAFSIQTVAEVWAAVRVTNVRARRLVEKCGFQSRGTGMARAAHGAFPVERFVLNRRAWASLKAWGAPVSNGINGDGSQQTAA